MMYVKVYFKGGATKLINGQALCPKCNLGKYNNYLPKPNVIMNNLELRGWQLEAHRRLMLLQGQKNTFLAVAGVGSGKTIFACYVANEMLNSKQSLNSINVELSLEEQLEKVTRLKQELEKLLQIAVNQGASEEEINRLLDDYNHAKRLIEIIRKKMNDGNQ